MTARDLYYPLYKNIHFKRKCSNFKKKSYISFLLSKKLVYFTYDRSETGRNFRYYFL